MEEQLITLVDIEYMSDNKEALKIFIDELRNIYEIEVSEDEELDLLAGEETVLEFVEKLGLY